MLKTKTETKTVTRKIQERFCDEPGCDRKAQGYACSICQADMCKDHIGHYDDEDDSDYETYRFTCRSCWELGAEYRKADLLRDEESEAQWLAYKAKCLKAREAMKAKAKI